MTSQGILFMSFLVYGLLLEVSKGQNIINGDKVSDASLLQTLTQTTTEPCLEAFEPARNCTGVIINQPVFGQDIQNDTLISGKGNISILIKQGVTNVQAPENRTQPQNIVFIRVHALAMKGKDSKGQVQLYSLIREKNEKDLIKARKSRKRGEHIGYVVTDGRNVGRNYMPVDETQNQTTEPHLMVFEKINIKDDSEENEPVTNNQLQNQTTEAPIGVFDGISTTDVPEELEPVANIQPQNQTITEPQIGIFDRINTTTDVPEKLKPVTNYTDAVIIRPIQGQELYNDILTQENENMSRVIKKEVTKVQAAESRGKTQNRIVMRAQALTMTGKDSKDQVKLYSRIGNYQGKEKGSYKSASGREQRQDRE